MFARRSLIALIDVLRAVDTLVADRARARERPVDWASVTDRIGMARVRRTGIVQVAEQTRLTRRTAAIEAADTVDASRTIEAGRIHAVVNVVAAVRPIPPVHADTVIAAVRVRAGRPVLADRRTQRTLVHVVLAELAGEAGRAAAVVGVDTVHACAPVLAQVARTVVRVLFTVFALEARRTFAFVGVLGRLLAGATVLAGRWRTRDVARLTVFAGVARFTHALVRAVRIDTFSAVLAWILRALVDVLHTVHASKTFRADALDVPVRRERTGATISAR